MVGLNMKTDQRSFAEKWKLNGNDLIDQGIYEWASEMLEPYSKILEIGCGTGQSTLILVTMGHSVFAIDKDDECISFALGTISVDWDCRITESFTMNDVDATLMQADIFCSDTVSRLQELKIDAIIIWQPGQTPNPLDLIDQCAKLAKIMKVPIQVMERANSKEEGIEILSDIAKDNQLRLIMSDVKKANWNQDGVKLLDINTETIFFAVGLFFPY